MRVNERLRTYSMLSQIVLKQLYRIEHEQKFFLLFLNVNMLQGSSILNFYYV